MKLAVVGTGYWGSNHARVAAELRDDGIVDEALLCDLDEKRVSTLADEHDLEYTLNHTELADSGVDIAVVATPPSTHAAIGTDLLNDGLDVLVEKPLADDPESANELVKVARETDAMLGVGHIFRHHPALNEVRNLLSDGYFGEVSHVRTARHAFEKPRSPGALHSLAVHDVDIYRYLLDQNPNSIYCRLDDAEETGHNDTATAIMEFGNVTGVISESWRIPVRGKRRDLTVVGSDAIAFVDYLEDTIVEIYDVEFEDASQRGHVPEAGDVAEVLEVDAGEPLRIEVQDFVKAVKNGRRPRTTGEDGAWAVELLDAAVESNSRNEVISLDE